jgi:hypothetical protein
VDLFVEANSFFTDPSPLILTVKEYFFISTKVAEIKRSAVTATDKGFWKVSVPFTFQLTNS